MDVSEVFLSCCHISFHNLKKRLTNSFLMENGFGVTGKRKKNKQTNSTLFTATKCAISFYINLSVPRCYGISSSISEKRSNFLAVGPRRAETVAEKRAGFSAVDCLLV